MRRRNFLIGFSVGLFVILAIGRVLPALPPAQSSPPAAPSLRVNGRTSTSVTWSWNRTSGATGYELHDDQHRVIQVLSASATSCTEAGLGKNSSITRHLHALNSGGPSAASNAVATHTYDSRE